MKFLRLLIVSFSFILLSCKKAGPSTPPFENAPQLIDVLPGPLDEASGIADSYSIPGYLWVEEDSGNPPELHLLRHNGTHGKTIFVKGAVNRDWEDMAIGAGPEASKNYIYLADIGDNAQAYSQYSIYRFEEPASSADTVYNYEKIEFKYPDGSHDAEAILIDKATKDIYIITKRDDPSKVYKLPYPQSNSSINTAVFVQNLPYKGVTSAAISADQKEILVKTYSSIYYYNVKTVQPVSEVLKQSCQSLPYQVEIQGEAICFKNDHTGFYTLSEKNISPSVKLNFYKRK